MCNSPAIQMTAKVVDFLVRHGQLPAVKDVDRRLLAVEQRLANKLIGLQSGLERKFIQALRERGRIPSNQRQQMDFISKIFDVPFEDMKQVISEESVEG